MTWRELAEKIEALTPEQQRMVVLIEDTIEREDWAIDELQVDKHGTPVIQF